MRLLPLVVLAATIACFADEQVREFPPECPNIGTLEIIDDPAAWADQCYKAVNGRLPFGGTAGDTLTARRDIDRDGTPELLEARGTGNKGKQIYVFRQTPDGFAYLGMLSAHPSFYVAYDESGELLILNLRRFGDGDVRLEHIKYKDREFVLVKQIQLQ